MTSTEARPWYREPWPWLLMSGPALVVIAALVTLAFALDGNDALVADDYYKRGLAINQVLARDQAAALHGYAASVAFSAGHSRARVTLAGRDAPPALLLTFVHPTRGGADRVVPLARVADAVYEALLEPPAAGRWRIVIEDAARTWRLTTEARVPEDAVLSVRAVTDEFRKND